MSGTDTETDIRQQLKDPSLWKIILWNDDWTPMDFVVSILVQIFNKNIEEATAIMLAVHENGKCNVGLYTKEVAQTKVILTMRTAETYGHPLLATAEEA